ncbi:MAG: PorT family protein [Bacteroidetes bacterium]|nr:PorT family protein [Bacteroidota bacterium]
MKQILNITLAAISFVIIATDQGYAQDDQLVNFGLKGGVNYSWLGLEDTKDETGKIGYHAGIFTRINLSTHIALQAEGLYTTKGSKVEYDNAFFDGDATLRLNYIEVPVLLVLKINKNINLQAGPYAAFILDASAKNNSSVNLFDFEEEIDKDNFKDTDWGIAVGIGAEVDHLQGGIRYTRGLDKIEEDKEFNGNNYTFTDASNSIVQLYVGFSF